MGKGLRSKSCKRNKKALRESFIFKSVSESRLQKVTKHHQALLDLANENNTESPVCMQITTSEENNLLPKKKTKKNKKFNPFGMSNRELNF